jgi:hypothetical protein
MFLGLQAGQGIAPRNGLDAVQAPFGKGHARAAEPLSPLKGPRNFKGDLKDFEVLPDALQKP